MTNLEPMSNRLRAVLLVAVVCWPRTAAAQTATTYTATWSSVDQHPPAPEWFQDAKFGIYYHWGAFSVPAFGNEWYPRNMYIGGSAENNHHMATYGDPSAWPYHNFINGARDKAGNFVQFAPEAGLGRAATSTRTRGRSCSPTPGRQVRRPGRRAPRRLLHVEQRVNQWNSVAARAPGSTWLRLHADAIRGQGLKFMVSLHHAYHFNGYYDHVPAQSDPTLKHLYGQLGTAAENQLWYDKLTRSSTATSPTSSGRTSTWARSPSRYRLQFLRTTTTRPSPGTRTSSPPTRTASTTRRGLRLRARRPGRPQTPYWLTDDTSSQLVLHRGHRLLLDPGAARCLIDRVSKNGNMLLNIAPMADGTIPQQQRRSCTSATT